MSFLALLEAGDLDLALGQESTPALDTHLMQSVELRAYAGGGSDDGGGDGGGGDDDGDEHHEIIPPEDVKVARWGIVDEKQRSKPDVEVWLVKSAVEPIKRFRIWEQNGSTKLQELCDIHNMEVKSVVTRNTSGGFINGRALLDTSITITTCGGEERPSYVYRVIHQGNDEAEPTPFAGLRARGYGERETDALGFQIMLQKHLTWTCREKSPFLAAVDSLEKAVKYCEVFRSRGLRDIQVLKIRTSGPEWDHGLQRLWSTAVLAHSFQLRNLNTFEHEYVIENSIPPEAVVSRMNLSDMEQMTGHDFKLAIEDAVKAEKFKEAREKKNVYTKNAAGKRKAERDPDAEPVDRTLSKGFGKLVIIGGKRRLLGAP